MKWLRYLSNLDRSNTYSEVAVPGMVLVVHSHVHYISDQGGGPLLIQAKPKNKMEWWMINQVIKRIINDPGRSSIRPWGYLSNHDGCHQVRGFFQIWNPPPLFWKMTILPLNIVWAQIIIYSSVIYKNITNPWTLKKNSWYIHIYK